MIKPEGRGFNSHPGQSFHLSCVGTIPSVGLMLTWSMDRKLALQVAIYHSVCSKYTCYTAYVCNKRYPSLYSDDDVGLYHYC